MRVEIDDADAAGSIGSGHELRQTKESSISNLVPAAEANGEMTGLQYSIDPTAVFEVSAFQIAIRALHVARIIERTSGVRRKSCQRLTQSARAFARAGSTEISLHPFVAREAE